MPSSADPVQWLACEYHELNGSHVEVLERPPTALEFSRLVHISRPVIIKGLEIPATMKWTNEYLIEEMGTRRLSVAITPNGRADAIAKGRDGGLYFAEPHVDKMSMSEFLSCLATTGSDHSEVCYLQSQNGNLYSSGYFKGQIENPSAEFEPLRKDVSSQISWCSEALDKHPDAVNLWIGNGKSVTSVHNDPYENLYTVIRGAKYFTLLPPTEGRYLEERWFPHAKYIRSAEGELELMPSGNITRVRWSSVIDPHMPGALPAEAHPIHVNLLPGETLYLPAGWWHHVRQATETTIAVNWWYDVEMRGVSWAMLSFMREFGPSDLEDGDDDLVTVTLKRERLTSS